ncbi:MAG: class I SAM-dependent methyltransferase [Leptospirales bacterium]
MLSGSHENQQYQDFLISESRRGLIPPDLYDALIPNFQEDMVLLDFGCGLGYTSGFYSEKFRNEKNLNIFACDYQVEILDSLWRRIVENKLKHITPFFMPKRSRLHFPKWILPADHVFFSLSLSTTENPVDVLTTIKPTLKEGGLVHIIGWDKEKTHPLLTDIVPEKERLSLGQVESYLGIARYNIIKQYKTSGPFFALTVVPQPVQDDSYTVKTEKPVPPKPDLPKPDLPKPDLPKPDLPQETPLENDKNEKDLIDEYLPIPPETLESPEEGS